MKKLIILVLLAYVFCSAIQPVEFMKDWKSVKQYYAENPLFGELYVKDIQDAGIRVKESITKTVQPVVDAFAEHIK